MWTCARNELREAWAAFGGCAQLLQHLERQLLPALEQQAECGSTAAAAAALETCAAQLRLLARLSGPLGTQLAGEMAGSTQAASRCGACSCQCAACVI